MSKWDEMIEFVNKYKKFRYKDMPGGMNTYINYLHKAGYLDRPVKGMYKLQFNIDNVTVKEVLNYAYGEKKGYLLKLIKQDILNKKIKKVKDV